MSDAAVEAARKVVREWTLKTCVGRSEVLGASDKMEVYEIEWLIEAIAAHTEAAVKGKSAWLEKVWGYLTDHARVIDDLTARLAAAEGRSEQ